MTIRIGNAHFPFDQLLGDTKSNLAIEIERTNRKREKLLRKCAKASSDPMAFDKAAKTYVKSAAVWLSALIEAAKKQDYAERYLIQRYREMARELRFLRPIEEDVEVFLKPKGGGRYRAYCSFGVQHRAAQAILCDLLRLRHQPKPWQYGVKGRGVAEAIKRIRKLHAEGYRYCAVLDITSFYDSFIQTQILSDILPVPYDLKRTAGIGRFCNLTCGGDPAEKKSTSYAEHSHTAISIIKLAGLLQGSAFSVLAALHVIANSEFNIPSSAAMLNYVDDFCLLAKSAERLEEATHALRAAVEAIPAGKFELLEKSSGSFTEGFTYLGHTISQDGQGAIRVKISAANENKFMTEIAEECERLEQLVGKPIQHNVAKQWLNDELLRIAHRFLCWLRTFSEADNVDEMRDYFVAVFGNVAERLGYDPETVIRKAKKMPHIDWAGYGD